MDIIIKYTDGSSASVAADSLHTYISSDYPNYVHYEGLIWENEQESQNDDGANAVAELKVDGKRFTEW